MSKVVSIKIGPAIEESFQGVAGKISSEFRDEIEGLGDKFQTKDDAKAIERQIDHEIKMIRALMWKRGRRR